MHEVAADTTVDRPAATRKTTQSNRILIIVMIGVCVLIALAVWRAR